MRYRLRTLLILLAIGPPLLAVGWMLAIGELVHPVLLGVAAYVGLVLMLIAASWIVGMFPSRKRLAGTCSYCGKAKRPLAEGIAGVLICRECAEACINLIDQELQKQQGPADSLPKAL